MRRSVATLPVLAAALGGLAACSTGVRRLDEQPFYEGPGYRLKAVLSYERIPLHFSGEIYSVECASEATRELPAHPTQDAGWRLLERGAALGIRRAADLVPRLAAHHVPIDERRLVWLGRLFQVSYDACGSFASWDPSSLPPEWIVPVEKPESCAPKGSADCRAMDFEGEREPRYDDIRVEPDGHIRFVARTRALHDADAVGLTSEDFGRTWAVERIGDATSDPRTP